MVNYTVVKLKTNMSIRTNKRPKINRRILLSALVALVTLLLVGSYILHRHLSSAPLSVPPAVTRPQAATNYSAATPQDNAANDARKSSPNPAETLNDGPTASSSVNPLGVIITNARRAGTDVRVGNIITGTTTGTCSLSATQAGQTAPAPVVAHVQQDVNNYDCGVMHITLPNIGTWQVKLTVTSGSNSASATTNVESN